MNYKLGLYLPILLLVGCGSESEENIAPTLKETVSIETPSKTAYPVYSFHTSEAGSITLTGSCNSETTTATAGENQIIFKNLDDATYSDCKLTVTDVTGLESEVLYISEFSVTATHPENSNLVKLNAEGTPIPVQNKNWEDLGSVENSQQWSCVMDIDEGNIWEVKTKTRDLRDAGWTYQNNTAINTPQDFDPTSNDASDPGQCPASQHHEDGIYCDTQQYIADVNDTTLCGKSDWALPTLPELKTLLICTYTVDCDLDNLPINTSYFPNTFAGDYWSSTSEGDFSAFIVGFNKGAGDTQENHKDSIWSARLLNRLP